MMQRMNTGLKIEHNDTRLPRPQARASNSFNPISYLKDSLSYGKDVINNWRGKGPKEVDDIGNYLKPMGDPAKNRWLFNGLPTDEFHKMNTFFPDYYNNTRLDKGLGNNSLIINAHGSGGPSQYGGPGNFVYSPDPETLTQSANLASKFKNPNVDFNMQEIAEKLGPATNNIHNFYSGACNRDGGCTPQLVHKYFPNATNISIVPPGRVGLNAETLGTSSEDIKKYFTDQIYKGKNLDAAQVNQYGLKGNEWVNRGLYMDNNPSYFKKPNRPDNLDLDRMTRELLEIK